MEWFFEIAIDVLGYLFLAGEDREWSIFRTSATLAVVIVLCILAYLFLSR